MALAKGQVKVRDLVMGPGTQYKTIDDFNPWGLEVDAPAGGRRAWGDGSWSGVEWATEKIIPWTVHATDPARRTQEGWLPLHQQLVAAFRPFGEDLAEVELRFYFDREYVLFGRPRAVDPEPRTTRHGYAFTRVAFAALDPTVYAGDETVVSGLGLPSFVGGLNVPFTVPFTVDATPVDGVTTLTNIGTKNTGLVLRIDGPVKVPRVTLLRADGTAQTLTFDITLGTGEWLDVDTRRRIVLLSGAASRRGVASGQWPMLPPGTHTLQWNASEFNDVAELTVRLRSAWW